MQIRFGWSVALILIGLASQVAYSQPARAINKDEVFHAIASQVITQSDSPLTNVKGAIDEVIEVGEATVNPKDGKSIVMVKEKAESNSIATNKSIQLIFARQPDGSWNREQFRNDLKFYPVEKLFPYAKDELTRRRDASNAAWKRYLNSIKLEGDAGLKVLDTAKAVLKKEMDAAAPIKTALDAFNKAVEAGEADNIKSTREDLLKTLEPVSKLSEDFSDLKANDAFLRLNEGFETTRKNVTAAFREYLTGLEVYNDRIQRLPFSLVAFGFGFLKLEPQIQPEQ